MLLTIHASRLVANVLWVVLDVDVVRISFRVLSIVSAKLMPARINPELT